MILWPPEFQPSACPVHVRDELATPADAAAVWSWLIRAESWPSWYGNSARVVIDNGAGPDLFPGATFTWRTFGIRLRSEVREFVPLQRVAWTAIGVGVEAYHAWLIEPRAKGCWILTEETQRGWLAVMNNVLRPSKMQREHQRWLRGLQERALTGPAPSLR